MARFHLPKAKCETKVAPKSAFAKDFGFRWVKSGKSFIMVGCPKGKTKTQAKGCKTTRRGKRICGRKIVCTVGTKAHVIVTPAKKGKRCPSGARRVGVTSRRGGVIRGRF